MSEEIEKVIVELLEELKPELKERAVFQIIDEDNGKTLATCERTFNPPKITFYLKSIKREFRTRLKSIISHELVHTFQKSELYGRFQDEKEAYSKMDEIKFFKEDE